MCSCPYVAVARSLQILKESRPTDLCHDPLPVGIFPVAEEFRSSQEAEDMAIPRKTRLKQRKSLKEKVLSFVSEKDVLYIYYVMFFGLDEPLICINQTIMFQYM